MNQKWDPRTVAYCETGAALLDRMRPGWFGEIDLRTLNIHSIDRCVLGQLYGSYGWGVVALGLSGGSDGYHHGFIFGENEIWKELILRRINPPSNFFTADEIVPIQEITPARELVSV